MTMSGPGLGDLSTFWQWDKCVWETVGRGSGVVLMKACILLLRLLQRVKLGWVLFLFLGFGTIIKKMIVFMYQQSYNFKKV